MLVNKKIMLTKKEFPGIILNPDGNIIMHGRWMDREIEGSASPINDWIDTYICNPADITCIDIYCEYFSGSGSLMLMSVLKKFLLIKLKDKKLLINWYYEEGDEDILEQGEYTSTTLEIPINFIMTAEYKTVNCLTCE